MVRLSRHSFSFLHVMNFQTNPLLMLRTIFHSSQLLCSVGIYFCFYHPWTKTSLANPTTTTNSISSKLSSLISCKKRIKNMIRELSISYSQFTKSRRRIFKVLFSVPIIILLFNDILISSTYPSNKRNLATTTATTSFNNNLLG